jgi:hypothetical protein
MARLNNRDVKEILDMLEDEVNSLPRVDKIEKMKMRSRIRRQTGWFLQLKNPSAEMIIQGLEGRLFDVFSQYPYGVREKVKKLLREKTESLRSS